MMSNYFKFRIILFALAFGLASVTFFNTFYENWKEVKVELPQVESASPLIVFAFKPEDFQITQAELIQDRDLSHYTLGKTFSNCLVELSEFKNCEKQTIKARNFIYNNWKANKRAYIVYEWTGVDTGSDTHIFIEPDENGKWTIALRSTGDFRYQKKVIEDRGISLRYKKATKNDPFEQGTFYLSVLDKNGDLIDKF